MKKRVVVYYREMGDRRQRGDIGIVYEETLCDRGFEGGRWCGEEKS